MDKALENPAVRYTLIGIIYALVFAAIIIHTVAHFGHVHSSPAVAPCPVIGQTHKILVTDTTLTPADTQAKRCDRLVFVASGHENHGMAFGEHEHHANYPGLGDGGVLQSGGEFSLILSQTGTYPVHDHLHDELHGQITIH
jgi:hypothetical protein